MRNHEHFRQSLFAAPQDISLPIFEALLAEGYDTVTWQTSASAVDAKCIGLNGEKFALADFISGLQHNAPIYEHGHVGDTCVMLVTGPSLPDKLVNAFGETS